MKPFLHSKMKNPDIISAKGTLGTLLRLADGSFVFRVYNKGRDFTDYKILYDDMVIEIVDDDAVFVGDEYIDATPP